MTKAVKLHSLYTRTGASTIDTVPDHGHEHGNGDNDNNDTKNDNFRRRFPPLSIFQRAELQGIIHHPSDVLFLFHVVFTVIWAMIQLHCIELPYHIRTRFKHSSKHHPVEWTWWSSVFFAILRASASKVHTMSQIRFVGKMMHVALPWQMLFMNHIKVTNDVQFKVNLDVLLRPERATLAEVREDLRRKGFSDDPLNPSIEYLESMHPHGSHGHVANLPEEVGTLETDGTYTLKGEWIEALDDPKHPDPRPRSKTVVLYFHGGAHAFCSPRSHRHMLSQIAKDIGPGTRVFSVDYRLAPENPFPAAIHDAFAAYLYLTEPEHAALVLDEGSAVHELAVDPRDIVVAGDSAGGNLAAAFMLYMASYQTASYDRLVDESRLYAHRLGLENQGRITRIEVYRDMVHVHQVLVLLFKSARVATKNLARFVERSQHMRDEEEHKTREEAAVASGERSYAAMLRKVPVRDQNHGHHHQNNEHGSGEVEYVPAYLLPLMVKEKAADGVEWVMVDQDGRELAGDEGVPSLEKMANAWVPRNIEE
ncbi:hypothetical protein BGZ58_001078 [Dissophora ornata]|nr:hypothetical protein BGZ58_001078 [Dissophora ornata]